jgi:lysophospholipase L1-like esterase
MPSPTPDPALEALVRFCHPRKILAATRLPAPDTLSEATLAALYGTTLERYRAAERLIAAEVAQLARRIEAHPGLAALPTGARLLAVGDSITDDAGSWAELLAAALAQRVTVVNAGLSGDTSADLVARSARLPPADVAVVLVGTNDARRHGRDGVPVLICDRGTARNVRVLDRALRRRCGRVLWVAPPPVDEARAAADEELRAAGLIWRLADVRRKAAVVGEATAGAAVDLWPAFGDPPQPRLLRPDGVHPSPAGQLVIAEAVLRALGGP